MSETEAVFAEDDVGPTKRSQTLVWQDNLSAAIRQISETGIWWGEDASPGGGLSFSFHFFSPECVTLQLCTRGVFAVFVDFQGPAKLEACFDCQRSGVMRAFAGPAPRLYVKMRATVACFQK